MITASSTRHRNEGVGESNRAAKRSRLTLLTRLFRFVLALLGFLSQSEPFRELRTAQRISSVHIGRQSNVLRLHTPRTGHPPPQSGRTRQRQGSRTRATAKGTRPRPSFDSTRPDPTRPDPTHHPAFQLRRLPIKDVTRLYTVIDHPDSPIEEAHEVTVSTVSDAVHRRVRAYVWSK